MKPIAIFGAGLAGLIAAKMLHEHSPQVYERQSKLPNNHNAVLRFRSSVVGDATNIAFKKVKVLKAVHESLNPVSDAIRYSLKVTGKLQLRSILDTDTVERYVAPADLVARLASTASITYDQDFLQWTNNLIKADRPAIISTMPMPAMMEMFKWPDAPKFDYASGWTYRMRLQPSLDAAMHATLYYPGDESFYRATVCGEEVILEGVGESEELHAVDVLSCLKSLGLKGDHILLAGPAKSSRYQKIGELNSTDRDSAKRFIMWLTQEHGIYSLGRYATWRPKLLLDDLVQDVRIIQSLIGGSGNYDLNLKMKTNSQ